MVQWIINQFLLINGYSTALIGLQYMYYLRANGTREHYWRDIELREAEVVAFRSFLLHDIHVNQVLCIALLDGN